METTVPSNHPILGNVLEDAKPATVGRIYTRTVVLWAHGIRIDPALLWEQVAVQDRCNGPIITKEEDLGVESGTVCPDRSKAFLRRRIHRRSVRSKVHVCQSQQQPVVRMMTTATKRRGHLLKRMRNNQSF